MEPVTHILTGACLSRSGLNRRAAYTTLAMAIGAEFPDIDTLWSLRGPVASFQHHRGITHTFVGIPVEAALIVAGVYLFHRWRSRSHDADVATAAPVNWGLLYAFTLLALLSHLFLDFTNNYGVRPFFPFNPHWYAASIVFIFDPLIFALLLFALLLPSIFRLVSSEVGARKQPFAARGFSILALALIGSLYVLREVQHNRAQQLAMQQSVQALVVQTPVAVSALSTDSDAGLAPSEPPPVLLQAQRSLANPDPFNPFRWYTVTDFGPFYQLGLASTITGTITPAQNLLQKLPESATLRAAEATQLGRAYLDWSPMPVITITPVSELGLDDNGNRLSAGHTLVTFADPRFMGEVPILHASGRTPLTGTVELDAANHVVSEAMDGKQQRR